MTSNTHETGGKCIHLSSHSEKEMAFLNEVFGLEAVAKGWAREQDRLYIVDNALDEGEIARLLQEPAPGSILECPAPSLPEGPLAEVLFTQEDGTAVTLIKHPEALPAPCREHWRDHFLMFSFQNEEIGFSAYHAIHRFACVNAADGKHRLFTPGGIRWVDYPDTETAISDALDMSLAVTMKLEVVKLPCAGSKVSIVGDKANKGAVLAALFKAMKRIGLCITAADLGLSTDDLQAHVTPEDPKAVVPIGVYRDGIPSGKVTADGTFAGLEGMVAALPGSPAIKDVTFAVQGLGEVGYFLAEKLLAVGASIYVSEINQEVVAKFLEENQDAVQAGRLNSLEDPDAIYDAPADIFCPCALRDILNEQSLERFKKAGVKLIGGPANNLFTDQITGPWMFLNAGIPVIPYEGIGAGGVTGVSYSIMSGFMGANPFPIAERITMIARYVEKIIRYAREYDLPPQVISDRILFRGGQRRTLFTRDQAFAFIERLKVGWANGPAAEQAVLTEWAKDGFFSGSGKFPGGGWKYL